jgi:hypothetical protein
MSKDVDVVSGAKFPECRDGICRNNLKEKEIVTVGQHGYPRSYQEGRNTAHSLSCSYFNTYRTQW